MSNNPSNNLSALASLSEIATAMKPSHLSSERASEQHEASASRQEESSSKEPLASLQDDAIKSYRPSKRVTFPLKLFDMLSRNDLVNVIVWAEHGRAWKVLDTKALEQILPQYFKHNSYLSFSRQVQLWGFQRIADGPLKGYYYHKLFVRSNPSLCKWIQRVVNKASSASNRENEPDFYSMGDVEDEIKAEFAANSKSLESENSVVVVPRASEETAGSATLVATSNAEVNSGPKDVAMAGSNSHTQLPSLPVPLQSAVLFDNTAQLLPQNPSCNDLEELIHQLSRRKQLRSQYIQQLQHRCLLIEQELNNIAPQAPPPASGRTFQSYPNQRILRGVNETFRI